MTMPKAKPAVVEKEDEVIFYDKFGVPWTRGNLKELVHSMYSFKEGLDSINYFFRNEEI